MAIRTVFLVQVYCVQQVNEYSVIPYWKETQSYLLKHRVTFRMNNLYNKSSSWLGTYLFSPIDFYKLYRVSTSQSKCLFEEGLTRRR